MKISRHFAITIITMIVIAIAAGVAIFLAKGYTFSPTEGRVVGTGIITIASEPDSASVFIDGHLTTATNATLSTLPPKEYIIRVVKEGFIPWEKKVMVKEGLVTELKITLFPAIPTIYPLTFTGVANSVLSPDGGKLAYIVPQGKKGGIWIWTMVNSQPIAFARSSAQVQIAKNGQPVDFSKAVLRFSPDSNQMIATVDNSNFLLNLDGMNSEPRDITPILEATLNSWEDDTKDKEVARIVSIKDLDTRKIASGSAVLKWSPDETKFIFREKPLSEKEKDHTTTISDLKVYDLEQKKDYQLPPARSHIWLPDSRHVVLVEEDKVSIVDFDGTNKAVIYAGKFEDNFVFAWPDSSRLVLITSFPTPTASEPNLYGINLR